MILILIPTQAQTVTEKQFEDYHDDSMELDDDYDSDDLSYTSCLSSQSNSNYSVVFEKDPTTMSPTSDQIPFSYHSFNNDCFLYTNTKSSLGISIPMNRSHPMSSSLQSPISSQSYYQCHHHQVSFVFLQLLHHVLPLQQIQYHNLWKWKDLFVDLLLVILYTCYLKCINIIIDPFSSSSPSTQSSSPSSTSHLYHYFLKTKYQIHVQKIHLFKSKYFFKTVS